MENNKNCNANFSCRPNNFLNHLVSAFQEYLRIKKKIIL